MVDSLSHQSMSPSPPAAASPDDSLREVRVDNPERSNEPTPQPRQPVLALFALEPGGALDERAKEHYHEAMRSANWSSTMFTEEPLSASLGKKFTQVFFLLFASYFCYVLLNLFAENLNTPTFWHPYLNFCSVKFEPLRLRNGTRAPHITSPGVASFGVLRDNCVLEDWELEGAQLVANGSQLLLFFPAPVTFNGMMLITSDADPAGDALAWQLYWSRDNVTWVKGDIFMMHSIPEFVRYFKESPGPNRRVLINWMPSKTLQFYVSFLSHALLVAGTGGSAVMGALHMEKNGSRWFALTFFIWMNLQFVLMGVESMEGFAGMRERVDVSSWLTPFVLGSISVTIILFQNFFLHHIAVIGFFFVVSGIGDSAVWGCKCVFIIITGLIISFFVACFVTFRWLSLFRSRQLVAADKGRYDQAWGVIVAQESNLEPLAKLAGVVQRIQSTCFNVHARQLNRARDLQGPRRNLELNFNTQQASAQPHMNSPAVNARNILERARQAVRDGSGQFRLLAQGGTDIWSSLSRGGRRGEGSRVSPTEGALGQGGGCRPSVRKIRQEKSAMLLGVDFMLESTTSNSVDVKRPVRSMQQLYVQASAVHPILIEKVMQWATASNGMFFKSWGGGFVGAQEASANRRMVKWAKIKSVQRAIEKLLRSYNGDASRLLDICRQTIVLPSIEALVVCLEQMEKDDEIVIVRVKNRLSLKSDASATAGYRDVAVNLKVATDETALNGVEGHVCEVQLIIQDFAALKTTGGHERYIKYRNARGQ